MQCPNQECRNSMSYVCSRGNKRIYKCGRCGCEKAEVLYNSDHSLKGSYITNSSINTLDKQRRG